jgi:hypothetical protein
MKKKRKASTKMTSRAAATMATNTKETVKNRIAALSQSSVDLCEKKESLQAVLKVLLNKEEPLELRCAALQTLQAASFMVASFQSCRRDYIAALRKLAVDPEPELRQRALGTLAREKDGFAQKN